MGHKTGLKISGAQGRSDPLGPSEVAKAFEDGETLELAQLAQAHTDDAIGTLVEVMGNPDAPANSRVSAATRILEFAHGRAAQTVKQESSGGGLTINILRLTDGETQREVLDAVEVAKEMLEGDVSKSPA